ncbi:MAG: cobyrinate a,c-diamide synthase [Candidatus Kryptoniota bacterium]
MQMYFDSYPRVVIGGLSGDSGKTVVTCGLARAIIKRGLRVSLFKKGPDYIDAAWLGAAAGGHVRNLDAYLMGNDGLVRSFLKGARGSAISIIEGNRGIFDGFDSKGTYSTAELAKLLKAPIVIVQDISKVTRTAAASISGCNNIDPVLKIAGVILNRVANKRHEQVVRRAIEELTGVPILGAIPKLPDEFSLPSRYLGLITPGEFENGSGVLDRLAKIMEDCVDTTAIINISKKVPPMKFEVEDVEQRVISASAKEKLRIAYFRDESFSFYYPENLETLSVHGAELIPISASADRIPEDIDLLYIGGGFPERNINKITANASALHAVKKMAEEGLPIYAECGGLIYLSRSLELNGKEYALSGVLPIKIRLYDFPQGHGYCEALVDGENPYFPVGTMLKGHEFHYSGITGYDPEVKFTVSVLRGNGAVANRDGILYKNVFASYMHLNAVSCPEWVNGVLRCARNYRMRKAKGGILETNIVEL